MRVAAIQPVEIDVKGSPVPAYLAVPKAAGTQPGMLVISEIFGANEHIQDVCMRLADSGYAAITVEHFHREKEPLTPYEQSAVALEKRARLRDENLVAEMQAAVTYLKGREEVGGKPVGSIGFCLGGRLSYLAACQIPELAACVVYYGGGIVNDNLTPQMPVAPVTLTPNIRCPVMGHFAEVDHTVPLEHVERIRKALIEAKVSHEIFVYEKTVHGFFCDARGAFEPKAAKLSWERTLAFLARHLEGSAERVSGARARPSSRKREAHHVQRGSRAERQANPRS